MAKHLIDLRSKNIEVEFHTSLVRDVFVTAKMATILKLDPIATYEKYPLYFFKKDNTYYLIARFWVYSLLIAKNILRFPGEITFNEKDISVIQSQNKPIKIKDLKKMSRSTSKDKSRKTKSISKSKESGRSCPYANKGNAHVLSSPLRAEPDKNGLIHIKCLERSKGCAFDGTVTEYERKQLRAFNYPTDIWFKKIPHSKCPACKRQPLYVRTIRTAADDVGQFIVCRNYFNLNDRCEYKAEEEG